MAHPDKQDAAENCVIAARKSLVYALFMLEDADNYTDLGRADALVSLCRTLGEIQLAHSNVISAVRIAEAK